MKNTQSHSYDVWNIKKQIINQKKGRKHFKERDVVFINIGENIGYEQNGKGNEFLRPVLVYKKFSTEIFLGIPLTRTSKDSHFYSSFNFKGKTSTAILSQIRLFDAKRIAYFYGKISVGNFKLIKEKLIEILQ